VIRLKLSTPRHLFLFLIAVSLVFPQLPAIALSKQPANKEEKTTSKCTEYKFVGMRGSGQEFDNPKEKSAENRQMGPEMASLYGYLRNFEEFKGNISFSGVPAYPAVGLPGKFDDWSNYIDSLGNVATLSLVKNYAAEVRTCPDTKFIIAGYSQGAYGAHYLVKYIEKWKSYLRNSIVGAIFLANPSENQGGYRGILFFPDLLRLARGINSKDIRSLQIEEVDKKYLKTLSYYKKGDIIANFSVNLRLAKGSKIHSSYCAPSGEFAPAEKSKRDGCDAAVNKDFLAKSAIYIREQLTELKRLDTQRRQRVFELYGKDWQVPTNCQQIMNKSFSKLQIDMADEFNESGVFRLRILAINLKDPSIWFLDEEDLQLVSYSSENGFYSLEASEEMERYFPANQSFENFFRDASKKGIISNLVFEKEDDWRCNIDISTSD
jgi:hypothetical protein